MKRAELFHPRVFSERKWAESYFRRNEKNIRRTAKRLADKLEESGFRSGTVLDAGCGFGAVPLELARRFPEAEITGVDLAAPLLEIARNDLEKHHVADRVSLQIEDVQALPFADDSFDVVVNSFLLHIVERPTDMLDELERTAKPDGRIVMTDLRRSRLGLFAKKIRTALTSDEAMSLINTSGIRAGNMSDGLFWWDYMTGL